MAWEDPKQQSRAPPPPSLIARIPAQLPLSVSRPPTAATLSEKQAHRPKRQTFIIGIDGSMHANAAFDWAAVHLLIKGDNLIVVRVLDEVDVRAQYMADRANGTRFLEQQLKDHASKLLSHYVPRLHRIAPHTSDVAVTARVKIGSPKDVLCTLAAEIRASRLVIGSRGATKRLIKFQRIETRPAIAGFRGTTLSGSGIGSCDIGAIIRELYGRFHVRDNSAV
ncbi:hypothetical protein HDU86_007309 [Geranomyces michiganensis]|nr:hypothetical protein HDU86_007309 [Geranomyces michiganensis]